LQKKINFVFFFGLFFSIFFVSLVRIHWKKRINFQSDFIGVLSLTKSGMAYFVCFDTKSDNPSTEKNPGIEEKKMKGIGRN